VAKGKREQLWRCIRWVTTIATILILFRIANRQSNDLKGLDFRFSPLWLCIAAIGTTTANLLLPLGWRHLISAYSQKIDRRRATKIWCLSQATRYLPTGLFAVATRINLAFKESVPRTITTSSIIIETLLLTGWAALIFAIFIPMTTIPILLKLSIGLVAIVGLAILPFALSRFAAKLTKTKQLSPNSSGLRLLYQADILFGLSVSSRAIGSVCLAMGFLTIQNNEITLLVGATYAGILAGLIGITPAGIGIREGVIITLLAPSFGSQDATAFALLSRAWEFSAEMLFLGAASWWEHKKGGSSHETQAT
jgi:uncharacterized membrane protein YbhN (UPF0104 family)